MKKIYNFINGVEFLNLYGTYEQGEEEEGEVYEVLNIRTLKQATPNLVVINMWGVSFVDDSHIEVRQGGGDGNILTDCFVCRPSAPTVSSWRCCVSTTAPECRAPH